MLRMRAKDFRPWKPSQCDRADVFAMKALAEGKASEGQQKRALQWILRTACGVGDNTFYPDSPRDSDFAQGKRFVGLEIVAMIEMPSAVLERKTDERSQP